MKQAFYWLILAIISYFVNVGFGLVINVAMWFFFLQHKLPSEKLKETFDLHTIQSANLSILKTSVLITPFVAFGFHWLIKRLKNAQQ